MPHRKLTPPLSITAVIHRGPSVIHIFGERSRHGWDISIENGAHQGHRKSKASAIKFAHDCCEPDLRAIFVVKPHLPDGEAPPPDNSNS